MIAAHLTHITFLYFHHLPLDVSIKVYFIEININFLKIFNVLCHLNVFISHLRPLHSFRIPHNDVLGSLFFTYFFAKFFVTDIIWEI